jgi:hypothetical protein
MTTRLATRAAALGLAAFCTLAMLVAVNTLAAVEASPAAMMAAASQPAA